MGRVEIRLNSRGVQALHRAPGVLADVASRAGRMAAAAGPGMLASSQVGRRARASVITADGQARRAEATSRSLTRAIDAGR